MHEVEHRVHDTELVLVAVSQYILILGKYECGDIDSKQTRHLVVNCENESEVKSL